MNLIYVGDIVNTHGLKGEVRINSDFKYKDQVFKESNNLYIGYDKEKLEIGTYRKHKTYDMVTFISKNSIEDVIGYKGDQVYIERSDYAFEGPLDEDLVGMEVYDKDKFIGSVTAVMKSVAQDILVIEKDEKKNMIPYVDEFIERIDLENKRIQVKTIEGLLNEN